MAAEPMFPDTPVLRFYDPLGDMLGAGDGIYQYSFDDAVKLAGHACPTVAGAFVMVKRAVELLYGDEGLIDFPGSIERNEDFMLGAAAAEHTGLDHFLDDADDPKGALADEDHLADTVTVQH